MKNENNYKLNKKSYPEYYLGLDIGTDSVGYAVADEGYKLLKHKGEPMWGSHIFDKAENADTRRGFRSARRRLDRRQQRVSLIGELFATEISKVDSKFFIRRQESFLYRENKNDSFRIFPAVDENKKYLKQYPTIHHLLLELMNSDEYHDVRLVYWACAWLVAHRGHFLNEVSKENIQDVLSFHSVYQGLIEKLKDEDGQFNLWDEAIDEKSIADVLSKNINITKKAKELGNVLYKGEKVPKKVDSTHIYSCDGIIKLLSGGKCAFKDLFGCDDYAELGSFSLADDETDLLEKLVEIGDDGEIVKALKSVYDWSLLVDVLGGKSSVSEAKVCVYEQHKKDLKFLKYFIKKYLPQKYDNIFRSATELNNYSLYVKNISAAAAERAKFSNKEDFSKYLLSALKGVTPDNKDKPMFDDMIERLELRKFLPKQKDGDNRVIPYQLYWYELNKILKNAENYLPFLRVKDDSKLSISDKIRSVFEFKVPYYVGPLCSYKSDNSWMKRKATGKIYPWNFDEIVDKDASEEQFIKRMTNSCTYLPGEGVLPYDSLCYSAFMVLNEINNIKINGLKIPVNAKQEIYNNLFLLKKKVTVKNIRDYLISNNYMQKDDVISGLDETVKSNLKSFLIFKNLLGNGILSEEDVEKIISRATYSEDRMRFTKWLKNEFSNLNESDVKYLSNQKFKEFGRLSKRFLCDIMGVDKLGGTGEVSSLMENLWNTNNNLMELLSEKFSFCEQIDEICAEYYGKNKKTISERLDDMYVSNGVKRPIIRTLDIVGDVVKVTGHAPSKIFVEMARDKNDVNQKQRTKTRFQQLMEIYTKIGSDVRVIKEQLMSLGESADNELQRNKLYLYYLQLGKCLYTGKPINVEALMKGDGTYNIEHIYPRSLVKDDSITNNEILVESKVNGEKSDQFPIKEEIQENMKGYWAYLNSVGLLSDEKYKRLTRKTHFTDEEKMNFINRQLVETRQSTKAVAEILKEMYPSSEIVYVKAGLVSDFRQEFDMLKSRVINDLHHAKDAYLNIVVGNVYHCRFSKQWFNLSQNYSMKTKEIFCHKVQNGSKIIWSGEDEIGKIRKAVDGNAVHFTKYAFCRKGGFFDQMPLAKKEGLVPLKKGLPTEIYGGYNKPTATFFVVASYFVKSKKDVMIVPVDLLVADKFLKDNEFAVKCTQNTIENILGKQVENVEILLNKRIIKINTVLSLDGFRVCITGKANGGKLIGLSGLTSFISGKDCFNYIRKLESFSKKVEKMPEIIPNTKFDGISKEENMKLYDCYINKFSLYPYSKRPNNPLDKLISGKNLFEQLEVKEQAILLLRIQSLLCRAVNIDLKIIGASASTGTMTLSTSISNWKKNYSDVRIVDTSASGLFESVSENILDLT